MKILFLAHRIPYPPNKGEKIRAFEELKFFAKRHTVDLFCFADSPEEASGQEALRPFCRYIHVETLSRVGNIFRAVRGFCMRQPLSVACFDSRRFHSAIRRRLAEHHYDLVFVYCSSVAQYASGITDTPVVVDFVDADSAKWAQYARFSPFPLSRIYSREAKRLACYEAKVTRSSRASVVATRQEAEQLGGGVRLPVEVISNGVSQPASVEGSGQAEDISRLQPYAVFIGTMDYRPNVDAVVHFTEQILPRIRQTNPNLRFVIVGRNPTRRVRQLARTPGVTVTGSVADVSPYLNGAAVAVAPFRIFQGLQNKILEALTSGVPVVSTSGPANALGLQHMESLLIADSPDGFARAVNLLLTDGDLRRRLAVAGAIVRKRFDWQTSLEQLERISEDVAQVGSEIALTTPGHARAS
jgi:sugar transferase (PEP-CTERM/EpsH1 system associated)